MAREADCGFRCRNPAYRRGAIAFLPVASPLAQRAYYPVGLLAHAMSLRPISFLMLNCQVDARLHLPGDSL